NRAFSPPDGPTPNPDGALVALTVPVGEPDAISHFVSPLFVFQPSGFPTCTGDLERRIVSCTGLVPGARYTLSGRRRRASGPASQAGVLRIPLGISRGEVVVLSNGSRTLTTLHLANLRVRIDGEQTALAGGSCQPGEYYGLPLRQPPISILAGYPS